MRLGRRFNCLLLTTTTVSSPPTTTTRAQIGRLIRQHHTHGRRCTQIARNRDSEDAPRPQLHTVILPGFPRAHGSPLALSRLAGHNMLAVRSTCGKTEHHRQGRHVCPRRTRRQHGRAPRVLRDGRRRAGALFCPLCETTGGSERVQGSVVNVDDLHLFCI